MKPFSFFVSITKKQLGWLLQLPLLFQFQLGKEWTEQKCLVVLNFQRKNNLACNTPICFHARFYFSAKWKVLFHLWFLLFQTLSSSTRASCYLDPWFSQILTALNTLPSRTKTHFCWESVVQYFIVALPTPPWEEGGALNKVLYGKVPPRGQSLILLYTIFDRKGTPFVYLPLKNGTLHPFSKPLECS